MKDQSAPTLSWRPVETDSDWDSAARLYNLDFEGIAWPGDVPRTDFGTLPADTPRLILLGSRRGEDVVYARCHGQPWYSGSSFAVRVSTWPGEEDLARAGLERLLEWGLLRSATRWEAMVRSDRPSRLATWMTFGFRVKMVAPESHLDLHLIDESRFQALAAQISAQGLTLTTKEEWHRGDLIDRYRARYEFEMEVYSDIPLPEPFVPEPFEAWLESNLPDRRNHHRSWLVLDGDRPVANTEFHGPLHAKESVQTWLTAVARSHRRRGLASALKAHALLWAKAAGYRWARTDNAETNPMFNLNKELGFRWVYDNLVLEASPADFRSRAASGPHAG
ncbi:MAG: GNAT family N-acetyltransferase [Fimbriimonadaceae bacterium]|nr:GNAT family N-acetyltransferase [Fimbriimonadaceae bacterium]